jgi:hypothetical protein
VHDHCGVKRNLVDQQLEIREGQFYCRVCLSFVNWKHACQHVWGLVRWILKFPCRELSLTKKVVYDQRGQGGTKHLKLVAKAGPQQLTMLHTGSQVVLSAAAQDEQGQTLSREQKMFTLQVCLFFLFFCLFVCVFFFFVLFSQFLAYLFSKRCTIGTVGPTDR